MFFWSEATLEAITESLARTRAGSPWLLVVVGDPGMGKTTLLAEIVGRASGFNVLRGAGEQVVYQGPFELLRQLGINDALSVNGAAKDPLVVTQMLRNRVDELSSSGPVLIVVDDLQWVDHLSLESLYWLMDRARGDRLLVVVGSRPERVQTSDAWRRLVHRAANQAATITLDGLTAQQTSALVRDLQPDAHDDSITRIWEHTGGNPFYLKSMLNQYRVEELEGMRTLPAPAELTTRIKAELTALPREAVALAHGSAVLGDLWTDIASVSNLAGVTSPGDALQALLDAGLVEVRTAEARTQVRASHALIRAAIYHAIPQPRRRELHLRIGAVSTDPMAVFEHRVAASDRHDDGLADDLARAGKAAHAGGDFHRARQLFAWSSDLTSDPRRGNQRWLEAAIDSILARDVATVRRQLPAIASAPDAARRAIIHGLLSGVEKRWSDALAAYTSLSPAAWAGADSMTRYRLRVLTAWAMICAGRDLADLDSLLADATAEAVHDPALVGNVIFAQGTLALRRSDPGRLADALDSIPTVPAATPAPVTYKLAWRGSIRALWGDSQRAEADLGETTTRIRTGVADNGDGVYHALLAFARWQHGSWNLAQVELGLALDHAVGQAHPITRAIEPLLLACRGHFALAEEKLREVSDVLRVMPWREPMHLYVISYVVCLHARGDAADQRAGLAHLRTVFGPNLTVVPGYTGAVWTFHLALAAIWAGDHDLASRFIMEGEAQPRPPGWLGWVCAWLRGLFAEGQGRTAEAAALLEEAVAGFTPELPFYQAHVLADRARIAARAGRLDLGDQSRASAEEMYRVLGAAPYLGRAAPVGADSSAARGSDVLAPLSDRERDVATLLVSGLSYAQIGAELFVSRATVGFHLSRIYAKTNVSTRHELVDLLRRSGQ